MKKLFFLMIACAIATTASAQFVNSGNAGVSKSGTGLSAMSTDDYNRFYVGYNPMKINWEDHQSDWEEEYPLTSSLTVGYLHASSLSKNIPLFLEYGANFQYSFGKEKEDGDEWGINVYSVNVPVNLAFKLQFNDVALTPYVGANFRVNAAGTYKYEYEDWDGETETEKINLFDDSDADDAMGDYAAKRFQAGINVGVGFSYKALYLGVGYVSDFSKVFDADEMEGKVGMTTLTVGINF